jgi:hypothetical protein
VSNVGTSAAERGVERTLYPNAIHADMTVPDGWTPILGGGWLEALHRRYADERDIVVFVQRIASGYEVRERTASAGSDPHETVVGVRDSLAAARELLIKTCQDWDTWLVQRATLGCAQ